ncbi:MAG: hypothetical protein RL026_1663 [Pseudomonadota bacterium]|jgi:uncharacterized RDD family membrane protein YckC
MSHPASGLTGPDASRRRRLAAAVLDYLFAMAAGAPAGLVAGFRGGPPADSMTGLALPEIYLLLVGVLALFVVQVWLLASRGQTLGKLILKIRIVRSTDGGNPGFVHAVLVRFLAVALLGAVPFVGWLFTLVDLLFIFGPDRRCLHDRMAGTRVLRLH